MSRLLKPLLPLVKALFKSPNNMPAATPHVTTNSTPNSSPKSLPRKFFAKITRFSGQTLAIILGAGLCYGAASMIWGAKSTLNHLANFTHQTKPIFISIHLLLIALLFIFWQPFTRFIAKKYQIPEKHLPAMQAQRQRIKICSMLLLIEVLLVIRPWSMF